MNFTIKVDIEDVWTGEDDLSNSIRSMIEKNVLDKIWDLIHDSIQERITAYIKGKIDNSLGRRISARITKIMKENKLPKGRGGSEMISIQEWIEDRFLKDSNWHSIQDRVGKVAEGFAKELRDKHDLLFASQIVSRLDKEGLLKDNVAQLLLKD